MMQERTKIYLSESNTQHSWKSDSDIIANAVFLCVSQQEKPKLIDPLDYEAVISELEPEFREDPLQDLLLFPDLDFTVSALLSLCVYLWWSYI